MTALLAGLLRRRHRLCAAAPPALGDGAAGGARGAERRARAPGRRCGPIELNRTNAALAAEIAEREAAETRVRRLRDELAQANRLSILGQVSAGVAHEINQPLAAIRTYAETGGRLLDAGQAGEARENLARDRRR